MRSFEWSPPPPLDLGAAPLLFEAALDRRLRRLRRPPTARDAERLVQLRDEALERQLAVAQLAALVLRDRAEHGAGLREHAPPLRVAERAGRLDVEHRLDARLVLLRVLSARSARPRRAERHIGQRQDDAARDPD